MNEVSNKLHSAGNFQGLVSDVERERERNCGNVKKGTNKNPVPEFPFGNRRN